MTPDEGLSMTGTPEMKADFAPCPFCKQYSHSIGEDQLAKALMHFQTMLAHPLRGTPMGEVFDEQTRDAAQVLMAAARTPEIPASDDVVEKVARAIYESAQAENGNHSALPWHIVRDGETAARWFAYARAAIAAYQASGEKDRG